MPFGAEKLEWLGYPVVKKAFPSDHLKGKIN